MRDAYTIARDALTGAPGCQVEPRTYLHYWLSSLQLGKLTITNANQ